METIGNRIFPSPLPVHLSDGAAGCSRAIETEEAEALLLLEEIHGLRLRAYTIGSNGLRFRVRY